MEKKHGSCHCGAVAYDVDIDLGQLMTCNCSICGRTGAIMAFVPQSAFTLQSGEGKLQDYQFGKKSIHHLFCSVCGVRPYSWGDGPDGSKMVSVNVRCLEGVDVHTLKYTTYDGKAL